MTFDFSMNWTIWGAAAFALSWMAVLAMRFAAEPLGMLDLPNDRSLHTDPTPRGGGLGFVVAFALVWFPASSHLGTIPNPSDFTCLWALFEFWLGWGWCPGQFAVGLLMMLLGLVCFNRFTDGSLVSI